MEAITMHIFIMVQTGIALMIIMSEKFLSNRLESMATQMNNQLMEQMHTCYSIEKQKHSRIYQWVFLYLNCCLKRLKMIKLLLKP